MVRIGLRWGMFGVTAISLVTISVMLLSDPAMAYYRYKNDAAQDGSQCSACHGDFTSDVSTKGTVFPSESKHEMHRSASAMNADCNLCHSNGDNKNPYIGFSQGTASNPGLGCLGCHGRDYGGSVGVTGAGLRAHHVINGITTCATACHPSDPTPLPEEVPPPYYGTPDTSADDTCNQMPAYLENWSIGDVLGLDNDGDNEYDECEVMDQDGDGILDDCDVDQNPGAPDVDGNGIIDSCECSWANIDGVNPVNLKDFAFLEKNWEQVGVGLVGDANNDGTVDIGDVALLARFWLANCD